MRRFIIIAATLLCGLLVESRLSAQDIILTTDNELISAVISEIGDNDIVYKKTANPEGPNYRINLSRVVKIKFANGTEQVFNQNTQAQPQNPEQVLFQPYAQPVTPVEETPVDWRHSFLHFYYWRVGFQLGNAYVPEEKYTYRTKLSYDILDDNRWIFPSNFTLSGLLGVSGRGAKFNDGDVFFDTHGLLFGVRPGYTVRFNPSLRISLMAGPYVYGDLWGRILSEGGDYLSVWNITDWNNFDVGVSAGFSLGISSFMEVYFEYRRGFLSFVKESDRHRYSSVYCFGVGFDF